MKITVNNTEYSVSEELAELKLSTYLRENLGLTGTKISCDIGICGSCTVLINNKPGRSCLLKLKDVANKEVLTIEGLASSDGTLHPVQQAFIDAGAIQCGFCTFCRGGIISCIKTYSTIHNNLPLRIACNSIFIQRLSQCFLCFSSIFLFY